MPKLLAERILIFLTLTEGVFRTSTAIHGGGGLSGALDIFRSYPLNLFNLFNEWTTQRANPIPSPLPWFKMSWATWESELSMKPQRASDPWMSLPVTIVVSMLTWSCNLPASLILVSSAELKTSTFLKWVTIPSRKEVVVKRCSWSWCFWIQQGSKTKKRRGEKRRNDYLSYDNIKNQNLEWVQPFSMNSWETRFCTRVSNLVIKYQKVSGKQCVTVFFSSKISKANIVTERETQDLGTVRTHHRGIFAWSFLQQLLYMATMIKAF